MGNLWVVGRSDMLGSSSMSGLGLGKGGEGKDGRTMLTVFFLCCGLTFSFMLGGSSDGGDIGCTVAFLIMGMIEFCLTGAGAGNFSLETVF